MTGKEILIKIGQMVLPPGRLHPDDRGFHLDDEAMLENYKRLYQYMLDGKTSITNNGILPNKGLMCCGGVGTGKTIFMRVKQQMALRIKGLENREMCIVSVDDFLKLYKEDQAAAFEAYGSDKKMEMCIDELGWEATQKHHYGNDVSAIIASWIMSRDKLFLETGIRTHVTTNLFLKKDTEAVDIARLYGPRIFDRLKEMMNLINWVGGSLRK